MQCISETCQCSVANYYFVTSHTAADIVKSLANGRCFESYLSKLGNKTGIFNLFFPGFGWQFISKPVYQIIKRLQAENPSFSFLTEQKENHEREPRISVSQAILWLSCWLTVHVQKHMLLTCWFSKFSEQDYRSNGFDLGRHTSLITSLWNQIYQLKSKRPFENKGQRFLILRASRANFTKRTAKAWSTQRYEWLGNFSI